MYFHPQGHMELNRKLYIILENKVVQKLIIQKLRLPNNNLNKIVLLNQYFPVEKIKKIF